MMQNWFREDAPIMKTLNIVCNIVLLNMLWLLCALPIVTLGASTTALYSCAFSLIRGDECGCREFFRAFKSNFKIATISWLTMLGVLILLYINLCFTAFSNWTISPYLLIIYGIITIIPLLTFPFLFPLISQFNAKLRHTLKNAFLCGISWLPRTLLIFVLQLIPVFWALCFPVSFMYLAWIWAFFGFTIITLLCSRLMNKPISVLKDQLLSRTDTRDRSSIV